MYVVLTRLVPLARKYHGVRQAQPMLKGTSRWRMMHKMVCSTSSRLTAPSVVSKNDMLEDAKIIIRKLEDVFHRHQVSKSVFFRQVSHPQGT